MMHPSYEAIEAFLRGEEPADPAAFRRHVADCAECAARLEEEARVDKALVAVAADQDLGRSGGNRRRIWIAAAVLSLIAFVAVARFGRMPSPEPPDVAGVDVREPGADPGTTDPRSELSAARTVAPDEMGAWTTPGPERLAIARVAAPTPN